MKSSLWTNLLLLTSPHLVPAPTSSPHLVPALTSSPHLVLALTSSPHRIAVAPSFIQLYNRLMSATSSRQPHPLYLTSSPPIAAVPSSPHLVALLHPSCSFSPHQLPVGSTAFDASATSSCYVHLWFLPSFFILLFNLMSLPPLSIMFYSASHLGRRRRHSTTDPSGVCCHLSTAKSVSWD